eukprot:jgi/Mesen1/1564/ME000134S00682
MSYNNGEYGEEYDDRYEQQEAGHDTPAYIPEVVVTFVQYFYRHIREKNVAEIYQMYDGSFSKISDRFFNKTPWPPVEAIADHVERDHVFGLLYNEMTFRHLYARCAPTLQQRFESWENYCSLFQVILHGNVNMQLPNQWLWDMIDEFIYQFQSFCQYRAKTKARSGEELALLRQYDQVWNVYGVLNYLQALIEKSQIVRILDDELDGKATFTETEGYDYQGGSNVLKVLGYFSIVGLLRVHCLLGDYHTALQKLAPIEIRRPGVFQRVLGCQVTTYYYYGFATMMLRRYVNSIKAFNQVLLIINRAKQFQEGLPQFDQVLKKNEQMYSLLAICLTLCPQSKLVEEGVNAALREKHADKMLRMQRGDEGVYDELFSMACPKFITPAPPNFDDPPTNYNQDAYRLQLKLFLGEVRQQGQLPAIRSLLKLYTTISVPKLASFLDMDEATLRSTLLTYKHKSHTVDEDGALASTAELDFFIDDDMVHVSDPKPTRRFGDYFIRHIMRFDDVVEELKPLPVEQ